MTFLVYDSVILGLIERLTLFDTYSPPVAYAIDGEDRRWCRYHAPPAARPAEPQQECLPRCAVCGAMLSGAMSDRAAKLEITLYSQINIDPQPMTIYAIVAALEKALIWQEGIWLREATIVGRALLARLQ